MIVSGFLVGRAGDRHETVLVVVHVERTLRDR